ncbi:hypothetical protein FJZ31_06595 [Candidatus Poribacteria bacterium]|nr:hypothetical protein [Candidatus Poribacteria bacterium]
MKKEKAIGIVLCLLTAYMLIGLIFTMVRAVTPTQVGSKSHNFKLSSSNGKRISLASYKRKSIVVMGIGNPYT